MYNFRNYKYRMKCWNWEYSRIFLLEKQGVIPMYAIKLYWSCGMLIDVFIINGVHHKIRCKIVAKSFSTLGRWFSSKSWDWFKYLVEHQNHKISDFKVIDVFYLFLDSSNQSIADFVARGKFRDNFLDAAIKLLNNMGKMVGIGMRKINLSWRALKA